jgi:hypothetical protein
MYTSVVIQPGQAGFGQTLVERLLAAGWTRPDPGALDLDGTSFLVGETEEGDLNIRDQGGVPEDTFSKIVGALTAISEFDATRITVHFSDPDTGRVTRENADYALARSLLIEWGSVSMQQVIVETWPYELDRNAQEMYEAVFDRLEKGAAR